MSYTPQSVVGPASSIDNEIARYDAITGRKIQGSCVYIDDCRNLSGLNNLIFGENIFICQYDGCLYYRDGSTACAISFCSFATHLCYLDDVSLCGLYTGCVLCWDGMCWVPGSACCVVCCCTECYTCYCCYSLYCYTVDVVYSIDFGMQSYSTVSVICSLSSY